MNCKLFESELKVMEILWNEGEKASRPSDGSVCQRQTSTVQIKDLDRGTVSAKRIAEVLKEQVGWSKTTTYTVLKKCVDKGAIERVEPGFLCRAKITREQAQRYETNELIDRMYGGRADQLVAALLDGGRLGAEEIARLRRLVDGQE